MMMYDDDRYLADWDEEDDWEEENERVYDFWDLVMDDMQKESESGKCHTHVYVPIGFAEKMVQYCCMNREVCTSADAIPSYAEAEALLNSYKKRGFELQYDMADGKLYRFDWNALDDHTELELFSFEKEVNGCKEWAKKCLEDAKEDEQEKKEIRRMFDLLNDWLARISKPVVQLT